MARTVDKGALAHLLPQGRWRLRVTPRSAQAAIEAGSDGVIEVRITEMPEGGRANAAVTRLLARALGVAPGRLRLVAGAKSRDKLFELD